MEVKLVYVSGSEKGITRKKTGKYFSYYNGTEKIKDESTLQRIKSLVIPPAWKGVWICTRVNGHLQATGIDARGRKQYRYHPVWNSSRNDKKFERLTEFGKVLPLLRIHLEEDINKLKLCQEKVIATVVSLMERTYIRIGNSVYERDNGSYGLTTLKDKHVKFDGSSLKLSFIGKKGIHHSIALSNKRLAKITKQCRDIPGKELFQFYDENGKAHPIDSGMVNNYIKDITHTDFTAKDFRTWAGTLNALRAFQKAGPADNVSAVKKNVVGALDFVSEQLGNTRTVCKKYYVHPLIISLYENKCLTPYLQELDKIEKTDGKAGLTCEEEILMKILSSVKHKKVA